MCKWTTNSWTPQSISIFNFDILWGSFAKDGDIKSQHFLTIFPVEQLCPTKPKVPIWLSAPALPAWCGSDLQGFTLHQPQPRLFPLKSRCSLSWELHFLISTGPAPGRLPPTSISIQFKSKSTPSLCLSVYFLLFWFPETRDISQLNTLVPLYIKPDGKE